MDEHEYRNKVAGHLTVIEELLRASLRRNEAEQRIEAGLARIEHKLGQLHRQLVVVTNKENQIMAVGEDLLAKVTEEDTLLDSVLALLQGLVNNNTIPQSVVDQIKAKIQGSEDKINAAIAANTPPPTP